MTKILIDKETVDRVLEGAANYIDKLGGDSRKYRQALAVAEQHKQSTEQEPVAWLNPYGGVVQKRMDGHERTHYTIPLYTSPPQHVLMASYYKELAAQEYKRGYADAMNWKAQNNLEHLPAKGEAAPRKPLTDEQIKKDFEKWAKENYVQGFEPYGDSYHNGHTRNRWQGWLAAHRAIEAAHGITGDKE